MEEKDILKMNLKELKRLQVAGKVLEKRLKQKEAAEILNLSERQIRRVVKRVKEEGEIGIVHKARGTSSNNKLPRSLKERVLKVYENKYRDFGPTLAKEKLEELDNLKISRETLRGWLIEAGLWKKKRKRRKHRLWRERKEHFGEMILLDGSHHPWLEERGPALVLMGYIDDATGETFARFYDYEGTFPALDSFKTYIKKYGLPLKVYLDKHTTYRSTKKLTLEEELQGIDKPLSQFERALEELGIEVIHANSPQAKGRIERRFGVFQDRLIKEMRLAGVKSKEEANRFLISYLPKFNQKFRVLPAKSEDLHLKVPKHLNLDQILSVKKKRTLRKDNTLSYKGKLYLVEEELSAKTITVEERTDGTIHLNCRGKYLNYKEIEARPILKNLTKPKPQSKKKSYIPPADHPWRKFKIKPVTHKDKINRKEEECLSLSPK